MSCWAICCVTSATTTTHLTFSKAEHSASLIIFFNLIISHFKIFIYYYCKLSRVILLLLKKKKHVFNTDNHFSKCQMLRCWLKIIELRVHQFLQIFYCFYLCWCGWAGKTCNYLSDTAAGGTGRYKINLSKNWHKPVSMIIRITTLLHLSLPFKMYSKLLLKDFQRVHCLRSA